MRASLGIAAVKVLRLSPFAAQAADLSARPYYAPPYYAPPLPVRSPWSGFYVGGFVGASIGQQKLDEHGANQFFATTGTGTATLLSPASDPETPFGLSGYKTGLTGGGFLGYNYQIGRMDIGTEDHFAAQKLVSSVDVDGAARANY